jgi:hypothetical protein
MLRSYSWGQVTMYVLTRRLGQSKFAFRALYFVSLFVALCKCFAVLEHLLARWARRREFARLLGAAELGACVMSRVTGPDHLILNQNFDRGLRARGLVFETPAQVSTDGLISVLVDVQTREVGFSYTAAGFVRGLAISGPVCVPCMWGLAVASSPAASARTPWADA